MTCLIRTTWLPYTQQLPKALREEFIEEIAADGKVRVAMVRLEVEAERPVRNRLPTGRGYGLRPRQMMTGV